MSEKILYVIHHYGLNNQLRKLKEEEYELDEAIIRYVMALQDNSDTKELEGLTKWNLDHFKKNVIEEMTDVIFLLTQIQLYFDIKTSDIEKILNYKIERQIERIKNENISNT